eukprot:1194641-Prorocentrum_minimum.AAC.2
MRHHHHTVRHLPEQHPRSPAAHNVQAHQRPVEFFGQVPRQSDQGDGKDLRLQISDVGYVAAGDAFSVRPVGVYPLPSSDWSTLYLKGFVIIGAGAVLVGDGQLEIGTLLAFYLAAHNLDVGLRDVLTGLQHFYSARSPLWHLVKVGPSVNL